MQRKAYYSQYQLISSCSLEYQVVFLSAYADIKFITRIATTDISLSRKNTINLLNHFDQVDIYFQSTPPTIYSSSFSKRSSGNR